MHCRRSSWVPQESQKSGSALWWLSEERDSEGKWRSGNSKVNNVMRGRSTCTLKFSMNPPLPSDVPRTPSEDGRADSDGSPIMHWERVDSSACKLSRSDERVRSFVREKGHESREKLENKLGYSLLNNVNKKSYYSTSSLLNCWAL